MFVFTKYDVSGASSRVRFFNYIKFKLLSFDANINSLFNDEYISNLYSMRGNSFFYVLKRYCIRIFFMFEAIFKKDDGLVWVEKELFPYIPIPFEFLFKLFGKKVIYDFDDAIFHNYDSRLFSSIFKWKFKVMMKNSHLVFAGNEYLSDKLSGMGAKNVVILPTVIDENVTNIPKQKTNNHRLTVGWIGSPSTQKYLDIVDSVIVKLQNEFEVDFCLIGANENIKLKSKVNIYKWSEETEYQLLSQFDVGIMPLYDSDFERGKCGFKILQYFAVSVPVVASPVGVNSSLIDNGIDGFLCFDEKDWYEKLKLLLGSEIKRREFGGAGRRKIIDYYNYSAQAKRVNEYISNSCS
ncbi:glycosyltransferase family 4 protein [Aeromonas caviae]|nr:glycosyltransferase family 4 protein [Aeromonas caviae]